MQLRLDHAGGVPIHLQIVQQVKRQVAAGRLEPGQALPPIRALAERLVVNPGTVARAYALLEEAGVVVKRSTAGTFVAPEAPRLSRAALRKALLPEIDRLLAEARTLGVGLDDLLALLRERHPRFDGGTSP
ncbi:MAG: GntR family transcriptional regulator [Gemmataceae bacterium]|nr:GntR family transcriptional regulator [Gemmataceae bacterium]